MHIAAVLTAGGGPVPKVDNAPFAVDYAHFGQHRGSVENLARGSGERWRERWRERGSHERGSSERGSSERGSSERFSSERGSNERFSNERGSSVARAE